MSIRTKTKMEKFNLIAKGGQACRFWPTGKDGCGFVGAVTKLAYIDRVGDVVCHVSGLTGPIPTDNVELVLLWNIRIAGYGSFSFVGTEAEARERRDDKAEWEGSRGSFSLVVAQFVPSGQERDVQKSETFEEFELGEWKASGCSPA